MRDDCRSFSKKKHFSPSAIFLLCTFSSLWMDSCLSYDETWNTNSSGDWNTASNWAPNTVPNAIGNSVGIINPPNSTGFVISMNTPGGATIGSLTFDNNAAGNSFTIGPDGTPDPLIFQTSSGGPSITVLNGGHEISCPININSSPLSVVVTNTADALQLAGVVSFASGSVINFSGNGQLEITGTSSNLGCPMTINANGGAASFLSLGKTSGAYALSILNVNTGIVECGAANQFAPSCIYTTELNLNSGTFNMNGFNQTIPSVSMSGGTFTFGGATLNISGIAVPNLNMSSGTSMNGNIILGSGAAFTGSGTVELNGTLDLGGGSPPLNIQLGTTTIDSYVTDGGIDLASTTFGTLVLTNSSNDYTGGTSIGQATLSCGNPNVIPSTGVVSLNYNLASVDNSTLNLNDNSQTIGGLTGVLNTFINLGSLSTTTLTFGDNVGGYSFLGNISGAGNVKMVSSTATPNSFGGVNTYGGTTEIASGDLQYASATALPSTTLVNLSSSSSELDVNSYSNVTIGNLTGVAGSVLQLGTVANTGFTLGDSSSQIFNGFIEGTGNIIKQGSGLLTLTAANTYSAGNSYGTTINDGSISISSDANLGDPMGDITFGASSTELSITATMNSARNVHLGTYTVYFNVPNALTNATFSGIFDGSALSFQNNLIVDGSGTLTLSGVETFTGATVVEGATLAIGAGGSLASSGSLSLIFNGNFDITNSGGTTISNLYGNSGSVITLGNQILTVNQSSASNLQAIIQDSGSGQFIMAGSSQITMNAANTYAGGTTIMSGQLVVNADNNLGNSSGPLTFTTSGGTLFVTTGFSTSRPISIPLSSDTGTFQLSGDLTLSGAISGTGTLVKTGANTLTISGPTTLPADTWATTIAQDTLSIGTAGQLGSGPITFGSMTPTLDVTGSSATPGTQGLIFGTNQATIEVDSGGSIIFNGGSDSSSGSLIKNGPGTLTFDAMPFAYTNGTTINDGTFALTGAASLDAFASLSMNGSTSIFDISGSTTVQTVGALTGISGPTIQLGSNTLGIRGGSIFDGTITDGGSGSGNITVFSFGSLQIPSTSTSSNYGSTIVQNASMQIDGTITNTNATSPNFTIDSSSNLSGTGTINGTVLIDGSFSPGNGIGTFNINGSYTQGASSSMFVTVDPSGNSSLVNVTGAAVIDPGTTVNVIFNPGSYPPPMHWTVITASGGITGSSINLVSSHPLAILTYQFTSSIPGDLILLELGGYLPFTTLVTQGNANAVANCVDNTTTIPGSDFGIIVGTLHMATSADELYIAFNEMQNSAFKALPLSQQEIFLEVQNALSHRYVSFYSTACNERELSKPSIWFDVFGSTQTQNGTQVAPFSPVPSYTTKSIGALFGVDSLVTNNFYIGAVTGYSAGFTSMHLDAGHGNIQSVYLGPYAKYGRENEDISPYADLSLLGEFNWYDTHREINFVNRTANGNHTGQGLLFHAGGGAWIKAGKVDVSPFVNFDLISMAENSYHESGANSLNLYVSSAYYLLTQAEGGVLARTCFKLPKGIIVPQLGFSILHENRTRGSHYNASLSGTDGCTFKVKGLNPDRILYVPEAEIKGLFLNNRFTASLYYQGKYGDDFTQSELGFQFAWNF